MLLYVIHENYNFFVSVERFATYYLFQNIQRTFKVTFP